MFLLHRPTQVLVEILELGDLFDPFHPEVLGRSHAGEELQDPDLFSKAEMGFPSGEELPICWLDAHYREHLHLGKPQIAVANA